MSVITNAYNNYTATNYNRSSSKEALSNEETSKTKNEANKTESDKKTTNKNNIGSFNWLQNAVSTTIAGMGLGPNDSVTFSTIIAYRDQLQSDFDTKVKEGLKKAGIAEDANFQLVSGENGGIKVISDHPDKEKIEKFFKDNPDLVKQFEKIQALNNVEESRKHQNIDVNAMRKRIQIESMTAWYANTGMGTNAIMNFTGGETAFLNGINRRV